MRVGRNPIQVVFRHVKKEEGLEKVTRAFDLLFDEVFRLMNEKPIVATK